MTPDIETMAAMCYMSMRLYDDENGKPRRLTQNEAEPVSFAVACMIYRLTGLGCEPHIVLHELMSDRESISEEKWVSLLTNAVTFHKVLG